MDVYTAFFAGAGIAFTCQILLSRGILKKSSIWKVAIEAAQTGHNVKMVLIVRPDLQMSKGKVASQCAHAALSCYKRCQTRAPDILNLWECVGQPKIIVRGDKDGEECLLELKRRAEELNLVSCLIRDAGRTQLEPGCATVLGIGPGPSPLVDKVTKHLKLL
ncbi:peptidyl-tRNA hydrolase 2, mitochondrial-like [Schistocerca nitens]|uniref:peptidyl-tRNA hydrolase 2, mitochondrial-like n=1 Tax=Schistocerca nitens TaxID=7011 RepID=UPI00211991C3|nr:peptidyl-tRNA hydrolase 2, mitochondrial-like [Schistocerca nitens]